MESPFAQIEGADALRSACRKPLIGLLGGIGSGKSTVARCFAERGCGVIDADAINRELLGEPAVRSEIVAAFGEAVLGADGALDTARLSEHVFGDIRHLRRLTDLMHPRILERILEQMRTFAADADVRAVVLDAPLLAEVGLHKICDAVVFVQADLAIRQRRVAASRGWSNEQFTRREKFQFPLDMKQAMSDDTVDNSHSLQTCAQQVGRALTEIHQKVLQRNRSERTA